jgi:hypothetical protein
MVLWLTTALVNAEDGRPARRQARLGAALGCALALTVLGAGCGSGAAHTASGGSGAMSSSAGATGGTGARGGTGGESGGGTGGGEPGASCGFTPCGGEPDGVWNAREVCLVELEPTPEPGCEHAFAHSAEIEGSYTFFKQTGRVLADVTITPFVTLDVDDACASALAGAPATAAFACPELQARYDADTAFVAAECGMEDAICHCVLEAPSASQNDLNSYSTEGTRIVDGQGDEVEYCVSGNELGIEFLDTDFRTVVWLDRG